jgi:O-antigen/teichoic acid export membrane protein
MSLYYGFLFFGKINGVQLIFKKKTYINTFITLLTVVLTIAITTPFVFKWGAQGAAWALFLVGLIVGAYAFVISQRYYKIHFEYKKIGMIFFIFSAASITLIVMKNAGWAYPLRLTTKLLVLSLYVCVGFKLGILTKDNYKIIRKLFLYNRFAPRKSK